MGGSLKAVAHFAGHGDGPGQKANGLRRGFGRDFFQADFPHFFHVLQLFRQLTDHLHHGHERRSTRADRRAQRAESEPLIQLEPPFDPRDQQMRVAMLLGIGIERPDEAEKERVVPLARLDGQQAHFQRPRAGLAQDRRVGQAIGDGKRRLVVGADHAHDFIIADDDQINVLVVEFVDQGAGPCRWMLRDFVDECAVIETVNLLEFLFRFRPFEKVWTDAQHSGTTSDGAFGGRPTREADALSQYPSKWRPRTTNRGYKSRHPFARTC